MKPKFPNSFGRQAICDMCRDACCRVECTRNVLKTGPYDSSTWDFGFCVVVFSILSYSTICLYMLYVFHYVVHSAGASFALGRARLAQGSWPPAAGARPRGLLAGPGP